MTEAPLLDVHDLSVALPAKRDWVTVVRSASFQIAPGEVVGLVGESGSGKTMTSMALMGLIAGMGGRVEADRLSFDGTDLRSLDEPAWLEVRGSKIGMIFQQPSRALDPAFTVGDQIAEGIRQHQRVSRRDAWKQAVAMLDRVHIANAETRAKDYPHMFSGGMCQRVMIAMALACEPRLLIADEPTTALDVTVQAKILALIEEIRAETGVAVLYITHDLGVVAEVCHRLTVMYAGETVESGGIRSVFGSPKHPYTSALLDAVPRPGMGKRLVAIPGQVPSVAEMPTGCRFGPRCTHCDFDRCATGEVKLLEIDSDRSVRCVRADELELQGVLG